MENSPCKRVIGIPCRVSKARIRHHDGSRSEFEIRSRSAIPSPLNHSSVDDQFAVDARLSDRETARQPIPPRSLPSVGKAESAPTAEIRRASPIAQSGHEPNLCIPSLRQRGGVRVLFGALAPRVRFIRGRLSTRFAHARSVRAGQAMPRRRDSAAFESLREHVPLRCQRMKPRSSRSHETEPAARSLRSSHAVGLSHSGE